MFGVEEFGGGDGLGDVREIYMGMSVNSTVTCAHAEGGGGAEGLLA